MCVAHTLRLYYRTRCTKRDLHFSKISPYKVFVDGLGTKYLYSFTKLSCVCVRIGATTTSILVAIMKFRQRFLEYIESVYIASALISFKLVCNYSSLAKYTSLLCGLPCDLVKSIVHINQSLFDSTDGQYGGVKLK